MEPPDLAAPSRHFRVGSVTVDAASRVVTVDGKVRAVGPKPLKILLALLHRSGETLSRAELKVAAWGDEAYGDNSLDEAISRLRSWLIPYASQLIVRSRTPADLPGYRVGLPVETWITGGLPRLSLDLVPGSRIAPRPDWRLVGPLDADGLAWRAIHDADGRAAVFLFADTPGRAGMLQREANCSRELGEKLGQPDGWLPVIDADLEASPPFILRPFAGTTLMAFSADGRLSGLEPNACVAMVARLARCVARAHAVGVVHGVIGPQNVFLDDAEGLAPLPTLARFQGAVGPRGLGDGPAALAAGALDPTAGSDGSGVPTTQGDVYALGILLSQLINDGFQTSGLRGGAPAKPDSLLREVIDAATATDPVRRLASAAALADLLEGFPRRRAMIEEAGRDAERARLRTRRGRNLRRSFVVAAAFVAVTIGAATVTQGIRRSAALQERRVADISGLVRVADASLIDDIASPAANAARVPLPALLAVLDRADDTLQGLIRMAPDDRQLLLLEARGLNEFARAYLKQGVVVRALAEATRASHIQRRLLAADPNDAGVLSDLADSERCTGEIDLEQRDFAAALAVREDVVRIAGQLVALGPPSAEAQIRLGRAEDALAFGQMTAGDNLKALATYAVARGVLAGAAVRSAGSAESIFELAVNQLGTGDDFDALGRYADALAAYRLAIPLYGRLVSLDGSNNLWRRDLQVAEGDIGDEQKQMKDFKGALVSYEATLEIARELADSDPTNAVWQRDLAVTYTDIGDAKEDLGDDPGAADAYRSAEMVFATLVGRTPGDVSLEHDFVATEMNLAESLGKNRDLVVAYPLAVDALSKARGLAIARPGDADMAELVKLAEGTLRHLTAPAVR